MSAVVKKIRPVLIFDGEKYIKQYPSVAVAAIVKKEPKVKSLPISYSDFICYFLGMDEEDVEDKDVIEYRPCFHKKGENTYIRIKYEDLGKVNSRDYIVVWSVIDTAGVSYSEPMKLYYHKDTGFDIWWRSLDHSGE